jgi:hypothetical protein
LEIQWLDFETRMRKIIKDLVAPVVERVQEDREQMLVLRRNNAKIEERVTNLEVIVFKDQTLSNLIDDLKLRIEEGEALIRKEVAEVRDTATNRLDEQQDQLFRVDGRISANEVLKHQFEVFVEKQAIFDAQWLGYKEEVREQVAGAKEQFNAEYRELLAELHEVKGLLTGQTPRIDDLEVQTRNLKEALVKEDARFEGLQRLMIGMEASKLDGERYRKDQQALHEANLLLHRKVDEAMNTQRALQNWVEKYEPLKVQHQITDTLSSCLNRKAKQKLGEYDLAVCEQMREKILNDYGHPSIKEKVLDLLSKLERESKEMMGPDGASGLRKRAGQSVSGNDGSTLGGNNASMMHHSKDEDDEEDGGATVHHRNPMGHGIPMGAKGTVGRTEQNKTTLTSQGGKGGHDFDEDSEGIEVVKEQMYAYS